MAGKAHHADPTYRSAAAHVRAQAYANPSTTCWRCGLTLDEARRIRPNETWQAGHLVDGDLSAGLMPEHARCNASAGAKALNAKRSSGYSW